MIFIAFVLNLPWTLVGLVIAVFSIPRSVGLDRRRLALIVGVRSLWWQLGGRRRVRATVIGHVVMMYRPLENDLEHELIHVDQAIRYPLIIPILYWIELIRVGYKNNRFEKEAYEKSGSLYLGK